MRGLVDEKNPRYFHEGCGHSATHEDPQCSPLFTCTARGVEEGNEVMEGVALQLQAWLMIVGLKDPFFIVMQLQKHVMHTLRVLWKNLVKLIVS